MFIALLQTEKKTIVYLYNTKCKLISGIVVANTETDNTHSNVEKLLVSVINMCSVET